MTKRAKILIVDDHPALREGLALRINRQADLVVCGEADSPAKALEQIAAHRPDLAIVDLTLKDGSGLDLVRAVAKRYPDVDVLVLSARDERLYAQRALAAGAKGYIMKHEATDRVIEAVRRILDGHVYLSDPMRVRLIDSLSSAGVATGVSPVEQLSDRELEVFRLLGTGAATREIADVLHVSPKTVQSYYERIKLRLNLASHTDLIRHAMLWANESQAQ